MDLVNIAQSAVGSQSCSANYTAVTLPPPPRMRRRWVEIWAQAGFDRISFGTKVGEKDWPRPVEAECAVDMKRVRFWILVSLLRLFLGRKRLHSPFVPSPHSRPPCPATAGFRSLPGPADQVAPALCEVYILCKACGCFHMPQALQGEDCNYMSRLPTFLSDVSKMSSCGNSRLKASTTVRPFASTLQLTLRPADSRDSCSQQDQPLYLH